MGAHRWCIVGATTWHIISRILTRAGNWQAQRRGGCTDYTTINPKNHIIAGGVVSPLESWDYAPLLIVEILIGDLASLLLLSMNRATNYP